MWTHLYNSDIRQENGAFVFNAYFSKDDGIDLNTGFSFDHTPTADEMNAVVVDYQKTLG